MVQAIPGGQRGGGAGREAVGRRRGLGGTYVPYNPTYNEHTQHVHNDEKILQSFFRKIHTFFLIYVHVKFFILVSFPDLSG